MKVGALLLKGPEQGRRREYRDGVISLLSVQPRGKRGYGVSGQSQPRAAGQEFITGPEGEGETREVREGGRGRNGGDRVTSNGQSVDLEQGRKKSG